MDKPLPEWVGQVVPYEYGEVMRSVWLAGARLVLDRMEAENERLTTICLKLEAERSEYFKTLAKVNAEAVKAERERCMRIVEQRCDYADSVKGSDKSSLIKSIKYSATMLMRVPGSGEGASESADAASPKEKP